MREKIEVVFHLSFAVKSCFVTFPGCQQVGLDDWNSDNRANSAQVQLNLPTRAELGNWYYLFELKFTNKKKVIMMKNSKF